MGNILAKPTTSDQQFGDRKKSVHNTTQGEIFCNCLSRLLPFSHACTQFRQSFSALPVFLAALCFYTPVTLTPHPAYAPRTGVCDQWAKDMILKAMPSAWSVTASSHPLQHVGSPVHS